MSDNDKFEKVMKTPEYTVINALGKYVYIAFKQRQQV